MALTKEQLAERRKGIGASDAAKIMAGEFHALWLDKTGRSEPEDLSGVWAVQLGCATESLNLDWYERKTGGEAVARGEIYICPDHPFLRCTLDGFDRKDRAVIEAKHVNGFSRIEDVRERYFPQVQHQMIVTGARKAILTVIIGSNEPVLETIEYDDFWATDYLARAKEFWGYVERDEEPPQGKPMDITPVAPEKMRTVDFTGNNEFAAQAADWLANQAAAKTFEGAAKALKAMVEPDVKLATGHGIAISRTGRGLSIKQEK